MKNKAINEKGSNFKDKERPGISGEELSENTEDGFFSLDREWRFSYANKKASAIAGKKAADLIGKVIWEEYPSLIGTELEAAYRQAMEKRVIHRFETKGVETGAWYNVFAIPSDEGITVYWQDISTQKRAEEEAKKANAGLAERTLELQAERQRLIGMLETLPVMVRLMKPDHRIVFSNRKFSEKFGETKGRRCHEYFCGNDMPCPFCEAFVPLETGKPHHWELNCPDGSMVIDAYDFPFSDADGSPLILEMDIDITERKKMDEALRESEERQAYLLKLSDAIRPLSDAKVIQDTAVGLLGRYLEASQASYTEFGGEFSVIKSEYLNDSDTSMTGTYRQEDFAECIAVLRSGRDMLISDIAASDLRERERANWEKRHVRSVVSVPLIKEGRLVASLAVRQASPREWVPEEVELVRETAERTWAAVERAKAEEALRESEDRLRFVLESCNIGAWDMSLENHITIRNREHDRIYGYDPMLPEWTYETFLEHVIPEDRDRVDTVFNQAVKAHTGWTFEFRIRRPDGRLRWIWATGNHRKDPDGVFRRAAGTVIDVTDKKLAEEALRESEEKYRELVENANSIIIGMDKGGIISSFNEYAQGYFGYSLEEAVGMDIRMLVPPAESISGRDLKNMADNILKNPDGFEENTNENVKKNGERVWISWRNKAIRNAAGDIVGNLAIGQDVTQQKNAEDAIKESEEKYHKLFTSMTEGCALCQMYYKDGLPVDWIYLDTNPAFESITGLKGAAGRKVSDLIPGIKETNPELFEKYSRVARSGLPEQFETYVPGLDSCFAVSVYSPGRDCFVAVFNDITERKRAEETLRESEERTLKAITEERQRLYDVLENLPAMVCLLSPDYHVPFANQAFRRKFGEPGGRRCYEFCMGKDKPCEFCESFIPLETGKPHNWESHPPDGSVIDVYDHPFTDVDGSPLILKMDIDITERKRAEEALRESEVRYRGAVQNTSAVILQVDPQGVILFANKRALEFFGYAEDELVGKHVIGTIVPEREKSGRDLAAMVAELSVDPERFNIHANENMCKSGERVWMEWNNTVIYDSEGRMKESLCIGIDATERKRAEEALQESEERYRGVVQNTTAIILRVDPQGVIRFANQRALEFFGYEEDEFVGKPVLGTMVPERETTGRDLASMVEEITANPDRFHTNANENMRKNGERVWMEWTNSGVYDGEGRLKEFLSVGIDATERKRAEKALRESEEKYRELVENSPAGIYEIDFRTGRYISVNDAMCIITGYSREELLGMSPPDLLDKESADRFRQRTKQWLSGEEPEESVDYKIIAKDGRELTALLNVKFTRDEKGDPLGASVIGYDITERKKAEEMINRQNSVLTSINEVYEASAASAGPQELGGKCLKIIKGLIGNGAGFIGEVTEDGGLQPIAFELGEEVSLPESMAGHRRINGAGIAGIYRSVIEKAQTLLTNDPSGYPEGTGTPAGHFRLDSFLGVPFIHEGKVVGLIGAANKKGGFSAEDSELLEAVTPSILEVILRKKAEEELQRSEKQALTLVKELEEADRNKNQFISVLSHELRNPLAAISAGVDLIDISDGQNRYEKARGIMKRQIKQLKKLIDGLLDISRITQNKIILKKEAVVLNEIVKNAAADLKPEFEKRGIRLYTKIHARPITLDADAVRIAQIIGNLLTNSIKFTQEDGIVWLTLVKKKNDAVITVKDNGAGIDKEIISRIFDPFTQAEQALDRRDGGLGLGLYIARGIAELHGGSVNVYSEGPGKGSEFSIHLPTAD